MITDAPQSIESSALRITFYSKNEYIYIYIYIFFFFFFLSLMYVIKYKTNKGIVVVLYRYLTLKFSEACEVKY